MGVTGRLLWSPWSGKEAVERTECSKAPALGREAIKEGTARAQAGTAREVGREAITRANTCWTLSWPGPRQSS